MSRNKNFPRRQLSGGQLSRGQFSSRAILHGVIILGAVIQGAIVWWGNYRGQFFLGALATWIPSIRKPWSLHDDLTMFSVNESLVLRYFLFKGATVLRTYRNIVKTPTVMPSVLSSFKRFLNRNRNFSSSKLFKFLLEVQNSFAE